MQPSTSKVNHAAVWTNIVLAQIIPYLWYSIFSHRWMELNNLTEEYLAASQSYGPFIISIFTSIITMYTLAWIFQRVDVFSAKGGAFAGFIIGVVFNFLSLVTIHTFSFRPLELAVIDGGANAIVFIIAGAILGGWQKKGAVAETPGL